MEEITIVVYNSLGIEINRIPTNQDNLADELVALVDVGLEPGDSIKFV